MATCAHVMLDTDAVKGEKREGGHSLHCQLEIGLEEARDFKAGSEEKERMKAAEASWESVLLSLFLNTSAASAHLTTITQQVSSEQVSKPNLIAISHCSASSSATESVFLEARFFNFHQLSLHCSTSSTPGHCMP